MTPEQEAVAERYWYPPVQEPIPTGRYHVEIRNVTLGHGSYRDERSVLIEDGPCVLGRCAKRHARVVE